MQKVRAIGLPSLHLGVSILIVNWKQISNNELFVILYSQSKTKSREKTAR